MTKNKYYIYQIGFDTEYKVQKKKLLANSKTNRLKRRADGHERTRDNSKSSES